MQESDVTPRQAAQQLGIRLDAVYALLWAGKLPGQKRDGRWFVPASAVQARLQQKREVKEAYSPASSGSRKKKKGCRERS